MYDNNELYDEFIFTSEDYLLIVKSMNDLLMDL